MPLTTRFAPSPTGRLHLGSAFSAAFAWRRARAAGGRFLLRLEDIDPVRCRPEYADGILEDLAWLGLGWDGDVRVQSRHLAEYRVALDRLAERGLAYPCFCSRNDVAREIAAAGHAPHAPDGGALYPGTCRKLPPVRRQARLAANRPHAMRLDVAAAMATLSSALSYIEEGEGRLPCDPAAFGDVVLWRRDAPGSYHLCVCHDDAAQGVTLVTRGDELRPATSVHRLLQVLMGWPEPTYAHHRMKLDASGRRLAKRDHAASIAGLREAGRSAAEVRRLAGVEV